MSGARVDEVAEGFAVFFKTLTVVATGGDAEIPQRDGLHGIAGGGFRGLNADTPGFAVRCMADGGDNVGVNTESEKVKTVPTRSAF
jgi:hypothetical protein